MPPGRFTFFWGVLFSQWHRSPFGLGGVLYNTAEQYMMAENARLFGEGAALARILAAEHSHDQNAIGCFVRGFDEAVWRARATVYRANRAKSRRTATCSRPKV